MINPLLFYINDNPHEIDLNSVELTYDFLESFVHEHYPLTANDTDMIMVYAAVDADSFETRLLRGQAISNPQDGLMILIYPSKLKEPDVETKN